MIVVPAFAGTTVWLELCNPLVREAAAAAGLLRIQHQQRSGRIELGDETGIVGAGDGDVAAGGEDAAIGLGYRSKRL